MSWTNELMNSCMRIGEVCLAALFLHSACGSVAAEFDFNAPAENDCQDELYLAYLPWWM